METRQATRGLTASISKTAWFRASITRLPRATTVMSLPLHHQEGDRCKGRKCTNYLRCLLSKCDQTEPTIAQWSTINASLHYQVRFYKYYGINYWTNMIDSEERDGLRTTLAFYCFLSQTQRTKWLLISWIILMCNVHAFVQKTMVWQAVAANLHTKLTFNLPQKDTNLRYFQVIQTDCFLLDPELVKLWSLACKLNKRSPKFTRNRLFCY